jgi:hypothetical protein
MTEGDREKKRQTERERERAREREREGDSQRILICIWAQHSLAMATHVPL